MKPGTLRFTSLEGIPISQYMMIIEKWPEEAQGGNWLLGTEWETAIMMEVTRCMNLSLLRLPYRKAGFHGYFGSPEERPTKTKSSRYSPAPPISHLFPIPSHFLYVRWYAFHLSNTETLTTPLQTHTHIDRHF